MWWCPPAILALGRLKQKDCEFKASLHYIARLSQKKTQRKTGCDGSHLYSQLLRRWRSKRSQFEANWEKVSCDSPISTSTMGVVVCSFKPSYKGGRGRRIVVQGKLWAKNKNKTGRPYLKNN
jgi:hypothetical protein